jgi:hypothetical protein
MKPACSRNIEAPAHFCAGNKALPARSAPVVAKVKGQNSNTQMIADTIFGLLKRPFITTPITIYATPAT